MRKLNYKFLSLAVAALAFTACEEGDLTATGEVEAAMGELYVNAEATASQVFGNIDEAMRKLDNGDALPYTIDAATFDVDPNDASRYILDYGTGTNTRGKVVKGQVIASLSGTDYLATGSSVDITYDNYFEDDKPVMGNVVATNASNANDTVFDLDINNLAIQDDGEQDSDGNMVYKTMTLNSEKTLTWTEGANTPSDVSDDRYEIADMAGSTGTVATYDDNQFSFNVTITSPLKIDNSCQYRLTQGVIDLDISTTKDPSPLTFTEATIDFREDDGCDRFLTLDLYNPSTETRLSDLTRQFGGF